MTSKWYVLAITAIILLSFFLTSTAFYPLVNSDMAVNVLMANDFEWPHDVYFWGQNRLGSFIPLIAHSLMNLTGISAVLAVSLCNYAVLFIGFLGFSTLFKKNFTVLLFALLWFFPYERFIGLNVFPLGLSYGLLGASILLYKALNFEKLFHWKNIVLGIFIVLALVSAVWISDLMMVTLTTLLLTVLLRLAINKESRNRIQFLKLIALAIILTIVYCVDLMYFKSLAVAEIKEFAGFNTFNQIGEALSIVISAIYSVLLFSDLAIIDIGAWILLVFFTFGLVLLFRNVKSIFRLTDFWTSFFLADFFGILLVIFVSHWVLLNEMGRWYFVAPYISACIWILRLMDQYVDLSKLRKAVLIVPVVVVCCSPVVTAYQLLGHYRSTRSVVAELNRLGEIGIIGTYWESYKFSLLNPNQVKSTPHDRSDVRNPDRIIPTILSNRVFLVLDNWLPTYPDSIQQFSYWLKKNGTPFRCANANFCEYQLYFNSPTEKGEVLHLKAPDFVHNGEMIASDSSIMFANDRKESYYSIYGPKIGVQKGNYCVRFYFNQFSAAELEKNLFVDIVHKGGTAVCKALMLSELKRVGRYYEVNFELKNTVLDIEFRFHELKPTSYTLKKVELSRIN